MSRIGNTPISVPDGVTVSVRDQSVTVKGSKGELSMTVPSNLTVHIDGSTVTVMNTSDEKSSHAMHGFIRALLANHIHGVEAGWIKVLELSGVGYRASVDNGNLILTVGFSHPITIIPPPNISFTIKEGKIEISGIDKHAVGQIAATIRNFKKPEPYKGKGIKYAGEYIRKKAGKAAKAVGGAVTK